MIFYGPTLDHNAHKRSSRSMVRLLRSVSLYFLSGIALATCCVLAFNVIIFAFENIANGPYRFVFIFLLFILFSNVAAKLLLFAERCI